MKRQYRISKEAIKDLNNIWRYTKENWSVEQADRYYKLIVEEIEYLSVHFGSGKSFGHIKEGYRGSKVKSHVVFYKMSADGVVEIVRILHQNMDIDNRLK